MEGDGGNWAVCKELGLWGTGSNRGRSVRAGDLLFIWRAGQGGGWLARCRVTEDSFEPSPSRPAPWEDCRTYRHLIPFEIEIEVDSPVRPGSTRNVQNLTGLDNVKLGQFPDLSQEQAQVITGLLSGDIETDGGTGVGPESRGRRNPPWARDELILALDLYLRKGWLDSTDQDVVELSRVLNDLPIHLERPDRDRFRNPNGVSLKLANFLALDPSQEATGMSRHGKLDAEVWNSLAHDSALVQHLAAEIRRLGESSAEIVALPVDDEDEVAEGRLVFREHRARERNRAIISRKKEQVRNQTGRLACEACDLDFAERYGDRGAGYIEVHHLIPLSESGPATTKLSDLALVCANCHRMIHRSQPWMSPDQIRNLILG